MYIRIWILSAVIYAHWNISPMIDGISVIWPSFLWDCTSSGMCSVHQRGHESHCHCEHPQSLYGTSKKVFLLRKFIYLIFLKILDIKDPKICFQDSVSFWDEIGRGATRGSYARSRPITSLATARGNLWRL